MYRLDGEGFHTVPMLMNHLVSSHQHVTKRSDIVLKRPVLKVTLLSHSLTHWSTVIYFRSCFTFVEKSLVLSCLIQGSPMLYLSKYFLDINVISFTYLNKDYITLPHV